MGWGEGKKRKLSNTTPAIGLEKEIVATFERVIKENNHKNKSHSTCRVEQRRRKPKTPTQKRSN